MPEGIIKFSVMPAGMKFSFFRELLHQFSFIVVTHIITSKIGALSMLLQLEKEVTKHVI